MARRIASFWPLRMSNRVASMRYAGGTEGVPIVYANYGAPVAADAAIGSAGIILSGQDISTAGSTSTFLAGFTQSEAQMSPYGRCMWMAASGASTANVTLAGRDYQGNRVSVQATLNGTSSVLFSKSIRQLTSVSWEAGGAVTLNLGLSNSFGLPFKFIAIQYELKNGLIAANAGTFVAGNSTQTITGQDPRGRYTIATVVPDGTNTFELYYLADRDNLHGVAPFSA